METSKRNEGGVEALNTMTPPTTIALRVAATGIHWGALGVSKMNLMDGGLHRGVDEGEEVANEDGEITTEAFVDVVVLNERDTLLCVVLGTGERAERVLNWLCTPQVRIASQYLLSLPLLLFNLLVLPGVVTPYASPILLLMVLPLVRSYAFKSVAMMKLLCFRVEFVAETVFVGVCLGFLGRALRWDVRAGFLMPIFFICFFDVRLRDARAVYIHSNTHNSRKMTSFEVINMRVGALLRLTALVILPLVMSLGLVAGADVTAAIVLRGDYNDPENMAKIRFFQFSQDFVSGLVLKGVIDFFLDMRLRRGEQVHLRHLRAPIAPVFVNRPLNVNERRMAESTFETPTRAGGNEGEEKPVRVTIVGGVPRSGFMTMGSTVFGE